MTTTREAPASYRNSALRPRGVSLVGEALRDIWGRRRLIGYLAQADLKKKGADTLLGNIWWVMDPLLQMAVYVVLVSIIFARPERDYPLFIFAAILPWKWFSSSIGDAITAVSGQDRLIKQVQFPKIVLPVAAILAGIAQFAFGLIPLAALLLLLFADRISPYLALIPAVALVQLAFTLALGLILAAVNVFFRDIGNLSRHALRLWFYLSPALYGASTVEQVTRDQPALGALLRLNPFYWLLTAYRDLIYDERAPDWASLGVVLAVSLALLALAAWFFKRLEPNFAKVL